MGSILYLNNATGFWQLPYVAPMRPPQSTQTVTTQLTGFLVNQITGNVNTNPAAVVGVVYPSGVTVQFTSAWGESATSGLTYRLISNGTAPSGNVFVINEL